jgi:signal transduction histidine kinase
MLIEGDAGKVNSEQKEYLDEIYKGNQRMVDLVNALLDVSRIELGTFAVEPQEVDLKELLNIVIKELKNKIKEKKIKLSSKVDNKIKKYFGDPKLLNIIFQNLLSNSVKYTPEGGKVDVSIKKGVEEIVITVQDSGMGIPKEQQDKIFSKLFRADNVRETDTEGTGLGLYIIKSIVDQSGGSISFVSAQDKGTTFTVRLPLKGMVKKEGTKRLGS